MTENVGASYRDEPGMFEHRTLNERVHQRIRDRILAGAIPLGAQLDEQALANELRISRTPVREAISKLTREGIVEYRPYKGNFVRTFTARQIDDLFEVRKVLESLAIRLAVARLNDANLAALRSILDDVHVALEQNNLPAYSAADRRFHALVAQIGENEALIEQLDRLSMPIQMMRSIANRDPDVVERTAHERPQILAALETRDVAAASRLMEQHIEGVRQAVVAQLNAHERRGSGQG